MTLITNAKGSIFQTSGSESWAFSSKGTSREINITQLLLSSCIPLCYLLHHCSPPGKCKRRNVIISQLYSVWHRLILGMISQPEWSLLLPVELDLQNHSWDDVIPRLPGSLIFLFFIKSTRSKAKYFSHLSFHKSQIEHPGVSCGEALCPILTPFGQSIFSSHCSFWDHNLSDCLSEPSRAHVDINHFCTAGVKMIHYWILASWNYFLRKAFQSCTYPWASFSRFPFLSITLWQEKNSVKIPQPCGASDCSIKCTLQNSQINRSTQWGKYLWPWPLTDLLTMQSQEEDSSSDSHCPLKWSQMYRVQNPGMISQRKLRLTC